MAEGPGRLENGAVGDFTKRRLGGHNISMLEWRIRQRLWVTRLDPDECVTAISALDWFPHPSTSAFRTFDPIRARADVQGFELIVGAALPGPALPEALALRGSISSLPDGSVVKTW